MKQSAPAESPDAYVHALAGWRKALVESLRKSTRSAGKLDERIKWGHLVYFSNGPVLLIRAGKLGQRFFRDESVRRETRPRAKIPVSDVCEADQILASRVHGALCQDHE